MLRKGSFASQPHHKLSRLKPKSLKSGMWNCRAYVKNADGSISRPSFTAYTRVDAERMAREFEANKARMQNVTNLTVEEAVSRYIDSKRDILSPTTIESYEKLARNQISRIGSVHIRELNGNTLQCWVNDMSHAVSPKTIRNACVPLRAALEQFMPDFWFNVRMPAKTRPVRHIPTDQDVELLIRSAYPNLRNAILLAAVGTLRRGEISAIKFKDISYDLNRISIHADIIYDHGKWVYKPLPKTESSIRIVEFPAEVIALLGHGDPDAYVVPMNPGTITGRFNDLRRELGLQCRFHDLRHYAASVRESLQIPRSYIAEAGGWAVSSHILDDVYTNPLDDRRQVYTDKVNSFFSEKLKGISKTGNKSGNGHRKKA
ncbi:Phage integrase family protein [Lachnospiraceae bacterium NK3A20]|nr:Phage integrase family protein [Lachnospiraceae bacterium NK3A20]